MAYYNKIGLLVLSKDKTKFLVCQKYAHNVTAEYIMPGGKNDEENDKECLRNEIQQELNCEVDFSTLKFVNAYEDIAAGFTDRTVEIRLYQAEIIGQPQASTEIERLHWIGKGDVENKKVSTIVRTKILPDLIKRDILR